jgi:hypothetical protein
MKLNFLSLNLLLAITYAFAETRTRLHTKAKVSSKAHTNVKTSTAKSNEGSGSWADGYTCQRTTLTTSAGVSYNANNNYIDPKALYLTTGDEKYCLNIKTDNPNPAAEYKAIYDKFGKFDSNTQYWCIHYRRISDYVNYWTAGGQENKRINFKIYSDDTSDWLEITFHLPYSYWSNYLSDTEGQTMANQILANRNTHNTAVKNAKTSISTSQSTYKTNYDFWVPLNKNETDLNATVTAKKATKKDNEQKIFEYERDAKDYETKISALKLELSKLTVNRDNITSYYNTAVKDNDAITKSLQTLTDNSADTNTLKTKLEAAVKLALSNYDTDAASLKVQVPPKVDAIDEARIALLAKDSGTFTTKLSTIVPT